MPDHSRAGGVLNETPAERPPRSRRRTWTIRLVLGAILLVASVYLVRMVGQVDWGEVRDALADLTWWQPIVLLVLLGLRQLCGALPLSLYVPGVTPFQAVQNDQVGILLSSFAPPPSDTAARTAMFSSWGVSIPVALAGTLLNTLTLFIVRFGAPAGAIVLALATGAEITTGWLDLIFVAASITILVSLLLIIRSDALARRVGLSGGRLAHRFRKSIDAEEWADGCVRFRGNIATNFRHGFRGSMLATIGMVAVDFTMLLLSLRFVGLTSAEVGVAPILIAYLFAFPLTLFPFFGLGLVDAAVITAVTEAAVGTGSEAAEAAAIAGLIVWRVFNTGGPLVLGGIALVSWKATMSRALR